jgi:tellurite resistance protein TerC
MHQRELIVFSIFIIFILLVLTIDLGVFSRKSHIIRLREAIAWSFIWITLAIGFYFLIRSHGDLIHGIKSDAQLNAIVNNYGHSMGAPAHTFEEKLQVYKESLSLEYITGYLIEYALSVDNVFVMVLIFLSFNVAQKYYKRVLFWGILGAIIMRFIFIFVSSALIQNFFWILYVFGALLVFTGIRMFISRNKEEKIETQKHPVVRFASKYFSVYPKYVGHHFWIRKNGRSLFTPLFLVLLVIEFSDVIFAVDSVPAIFSVTKDPYIVFFSNVFAILGLRSLFFLVMNLMNSLVYLKHGLSFLLTFIGVKMFIGDWLKENGFTTEYSLYIVLLILTVSIASSLFSKRKMKKHVV